jgi:hypothetical protein
MFLLFENEVDSFSYVGCLLRALDSLGELLEDQDTLLHPPMGRTVTGKLLRARLDLLFRF